MSTWSIVWEAEPVLRSSTDDLLTAGLGFSGLRSPDLPENATPRMAAIHKDIRDLVNVSSDDHFLSNAFEKVEGWEHVCLLQLEGWAHAFTVKLLIPKAFDTDRPTLIVAPSSGSRGVTGAIGDVGAWALSSGCAIALCDKGTGGVQILNPDTCFAPNFEPVADQDSPTNFRLPKSSALKRFSKSNSDVIALKHAHSEDNIEASWPDSVIAAAEYSIARITGRNNRSISIQGCDELAVIAAGVSNGGGAVLKAMEKDDRGCLDGVVALEPNVTPCSRDPFQVIVGDRLLQQPGRSLLDYSTAMNLLVPAALLAPDLRNSPFAAVNLSNETRLENWSRELGRRHVLSGRTSCERAEDALSKIHKVGFLSQSDHLLHAMSFMQVWPSVSHTFVCANGRYPVHSDPIGASVHLAKTDELGQQLECLGPEAPETIRFYSALSGGLSPGGGAVTIYRNRDIHPSLEDAIELRRLATTGGFSGRRVRAGAKETFANAHGKEKPTIIIHGRCDSLISVDHSSRAYVASLFASGTNNKHLRYYEHESGQHFEALLAMPELSSRYTSLLPAFFEALTVARQHLFSGSTLPPSQVLRTLRGEAKSSSDVPVLTDNPGENEITNRANQLRIPA